MTDRIEAIRARYAVRLAGDGKTVWANRVDDDMAVLLAEVERLQASVDDFNEEIANCEVLEYKAQVDRVTALATNWERLAATAMDPEVREWLTAASSSLRAALAPVAPDAEPGGGDPWCREESCTWRHWRSGSMPTHRRGDDCPTPGGAS